jgi:hypothetical protein
MLEAGVRDHRVEAAEALERGVDNRAVPRVRRQVGIVEVDRVDQPPVAFEPRGNRSPDAPGGARD